MEQTDIKSMTMAEIQESFAQMDLPGYKAKQVYKWLHRGVSSFDEMTDQSKKTREILSEK